MDAGIERDLYRDRLGYRINQARNAILIAMEQELAPLELTAAQFILVLGIANGRAGTPTEIAKLLASDSGATTRLLDRIERKGIIRRVRSTTDRRTINIELTAKGRALHPQIMVAMDKVHERLLAPFSEAELEQLDALLCKIATGQEKNS